VSGTIDSVNFVNAAGVVVATMRATGGLGYDVAGYRAAQLSGSTLPDYFGADPIHYDASGITQGGLFLTAKFWGGFGQDSIIGSGFGDALSGSHGHDTIRGGAGADVLYGDDLGITMVGFDETGNDALYGDAGDDAIYGNAGDDKLYGGLGNDRLVGDLIGETGADTLDGGAGNDVLWGGEGNDLLRGGAGYDRVAPHLNQSGTSVYRINLATGTMTGQGTDRLESIEGATGGLMQANALTGNGGSNGLIGGEMNDMLSGGAGDDRLQSLGGVDRIDGGDGADLIAGGAGVDQLSGGAGADRFVFDLAGAYHADRITDFAHGSDKILLAYALIFEPVGALRASAFKRIDGGALDSDDRVLHNRATGEVFIDLDGSGAGQAALVAKVAPGVVLSAADFQILSPYDLLNFT
jgi:Ca2+-binding RTX toxin-like protein